MPAMAVAGLILMPIDGYAVQLHARSEGVITHQMGHLFFLFSMVALIFTVTGKGLDKQKGWRLIQYSAFFFILWNLDAIAAHFFDNQIYAVKIENISLSQIKVVTINDSSILAWLYYFLKLDHLLCLPAMFFLYRGLSSLVDDQRQMMTKKDTP
jgi:energy-converting hydrogenase Eha subunit B